MGSKRHEGEAGHCCLETTLASEDQQSTTMARYTDPVCKRCRREQQKLYLKGARCYSPKCPIDREMPPPGMHGHRKGKLSEYGIRLREKQKLKFFYGVLERQFRR